MAKALSRKHQEFAKNIVKFKGNRKRAYLATYPEASEKCASSLASRAIQRRPAILEQAQRISNKKGYDLEWYVTNIGELSKANKQIVVNGDLRETPDNSTRLGASKIGLEIHGIKTGFHTPETQVNLQVNQLIQEKAGKRLDKLLRMFASRQEPEPEDQGTETVEMLDTKLSGDDRGFHVETEEGSESEPELNDTEPVPDNTLEE